MASSAVSSQGTRFFIQDGTADLDPASATDFPAVGVLGAAVAGFLETQEHRSYSGFDGQASEIDVTTLVSTAREKRLGLQDFGSFSVDLNIVDTEPFQVEAAEAKAAGSMRWFRLVYANGAERRFQGYVRSISESGSVDAVAQGTMGITINGDVISVAAPAATTP